MRSYSLDLDYCNGPWLHLCADPVRWRVILRTAGWLASGLNALRLESASDRVWTWAVANYDVVSIPLHLDQLWDMGVRAGDLLKVCEEVGGHPAELREFWAAWGWSEAVWREFGQRVADEVDLMRLDADMRITELGL